MMSRCKSIAYIALSASAACSAGGRVEPDGSPAVIDPGPDDPRPRPPQGTPADGPPPEDGPPADGPADSGGGGGGGGSTGFLDACLLPGMTRATFHQTGTIDPNDEGVTAALSLPFPFALGGTTHTSYWITTNGQLGFGATPGGSAFGQVTCPLPDARFASPILLAYSADLVTRIDDQSGVCYAVTGTSPKRKLVVTWKDAFFYEAWLTSHVTFSAVLNEGSNVIDVAIDRVNAPSLPAFEGGAAAALGRQAGESGYSFSCFQQAPAGTIVHYNP
jgi:hypothetical protein